MVQKQNRKSPATIAAINKEYVQSLQQKIDRKKARKIRLYRRLTVFAVAALLILGYLTHSFFEQKKILALKEQEKAEMLAELKEIEDEQEMLMNQLAKLEDDEYIAKLARQEYFLSDKNEIIFSMPNQKAEDKKKTEEKE
ncbi:FtsB family cell division protein [Sporosarcina jiandibaonis]|uniref:FtsB family cell division protein n=1 Tax=Sporosarcina jiandibaonis TaxID=2715535 RepID=UPI001556240C|nr:septum formation initiator family protein [Sporosarcina jiandibaonis]